MIKSITRRNFLKGMVVGGAAVGSMGLLAACGSSDSSSTSSSESSSSEDTSSSASSESTETAESTTTGGSYWNDDYLLDSITVASSSDGGTFYPGQGMPWGGIETNVYQHLARTLDGVLYLELLKSAEVIDGTDGTQYDCELWDFIYDTDGNNMTASDIQFCFDEYIHNQGWTGAFTKVDYDREDSGVEVTGDYTFILHLTDAFSIGEENKVLSGMPMFTKAAYDSTGDDQMATTAIGTGPYKVESYTSGSQLVLTANEDFWMRNIDDEEWLATNYYDSYAQNSREIVIDVVTEASSRAIALETGAAIAVGSLNVLDAEVYLADPSMGIVPVEVEQTAPISFYFNCSDNSIFSNVDMRKAVCYAVDSDAYVDGVSSPTVAADGLLPRSYDAIDRWNDPDYGYYEYDLELAQSLVDSAGYDGSGITILYSSSASDALSDCVIMLQDSLKQIGIESTLLPVDRMVLDSYKADFTCFDIFVDSLGAGSNYDYSLLMRFYSEDSAEHMNGNQVIGILDETMDQLYEDILAAGTDETAYAAAVEAFDDYFTYEQCYGYSMILYSSYAAYLDDYNVVYHTDSVVPGAITEA